MSKIRNAFGVDARVELVEMVAEPVKEAMVVAVSVAWVVRSCRG